MGLSKFFKFFSRLLTCFLFSISAAYSQEIVDPCDAAIENYQEDQRTFRELSQDCLAEAGWHPKASLWDCPSVPYDTFTTMVAKREMNRDEVCKQCGGEWPLKDLGPGSCFE